MAKGRIFLSHLSTETELAQLLKRRISADFPDMVDVFVSSDRTSIRAGKKWLDELSDALENSQVFLVLCSEESIGRPWVNFEAGAGWVRAARIVPICHSGLAPDDVPPPLSMLESVEANKEAGLQKLYDTIAEVYDIHSPSADFEAIALDVERMEARYERRRLLESCVAEPRILCAASPWMSRKFEKDAEILEQAFPGSVTVERKLTPDRLWSLLTTEHFDLVHLVCPVHAPTGDLLLSTQAPQLALESKGNRVAPKELAELLAETQAKLVVLATCHALLTAVAVARVANMIATNIEISDDDVASWATRFYGLLAGGKSLFRAFDLAPGSSNMPLVRREDVAFALPPIED